MIYIKICTKIAHCYSNKTQFMFCWKLLSMAIVTLACVLRRSKGLLCSFSTKNVVFMGTPEVGALSLQGLITASKNNNFRIVAAVTQPPTQTNHGSRISAVHSIADLHDIPVFVPDNTKDESFLEAMRALNIDLCITAAYGNYLTKSFLSIPRLGTVNIHPSLLPRYRGAAPVQRCLENGDTVTGVTILFTITKMDAGPIISQEKYYLTGQEKATELLPTLFKMGTNLLIKNLPQIFDQSIQIYPQDERLATKATKLSMENDSIINFENLSANQIHNHVRGM